MSALASQALSHIKDVLGIDVPRMAPWARADELPYHLRDAFELGEVVLLGQRVVLALDKAPVSRSLSEARHGLARLAALAGQPVVYVVGALASHERRRLIQQKVPFIVPGNQLYLPDLGLDLREYFRQRARAADAALSPSAQAMLIAALLQQPWQEAWCPAVVGARLGYTPMTQSRAAQELTAAGLATSYTQGRTRWLRMASAPAEVWAQAQQVLSTPVKRCVWLGPEGAGATYVRRMAGLSALARYSMLADSPWPVFAVSAAEWRAAAAAGALALPEPVDGGHELQLWSYSPALGGPPDVVDPLSLMLSLRDHADERVQQALDELKATFPW